MRQECATTAAVVPGIVGGMADHPPLPDFGDEPGLYRLDRWAKAHDRDMLAVASYPASVSQSL